MHHIFVNNKPIILTSTVERETNFKNFLLKDVSVKAILKALSKGAHKSVRLICKDETMALKLFLNKLPNIVAGGGKVINNKGEILFIYRNNKWDLPKGKTEPNETIELTALREVEEETGVKNLSITKPLETTYHIFKRNDKYKIKITHWFEMYSDYQGNLTPQLKENITKAKWLSEQDVSVALKTSYANIRCLF